MLEAVGGDNHGGSVEDGQWKVSSRGLPRLAEGGVDGVGGPEIGWDEVHFCRWAGKHVVALWFAEVYNPDM